MLLPLLFLPLLLLAPLPCVAQPNNAITLSAGFTARTITPPVAGLGNVAFSTGVGGAGAFTWNRALHRRDRILVSLDLPFAVTGSSSAQVGAVVAGVQEAAFFLTPGVQLKLWPQERMAPYATLGAGLASVGSISGRAGGGLSSGSIGVTNGLGLGFATGVDVKIVKVLYFRPEFRRFTARVPGPGRDGSVFRGNALFTFGLGFHF